MHHFSDDQEITLSNTTNYRIQGSKQWVIRKLKEPSENFNIMKKDRETLKKNQMKMKDTLIELNTL